MAVRWVPPPRTDGVVMAGAGTGRAQVRDLVAVAFYPVLLGRAQQLVYVMSVGRWDASRNERSLVRSYFLYEGRYSMNNSVNRCTDYDPGQLSPVDNRIPSAQDCLRFSQAEVDRSLDENSWARFGWTAACHADGYVVALVATIATINNPIHQPMQAILLKARD